MPARAFCVGNPMQAKCLHCRSRPSYPPKWRGLCRACYTQAKIRSRYPLLSVAGNHRGVLAPTAIVDPEPCFSLPGSPEKLAELCRRAEMGQRLWSRQDETGDD